jgi:sterol desaturase/sphingolipid hydroxylase (fatty acid hydroxylase superfamily)
MSLFVATVLVPPVLSLIAFLVLATLYTLPFVDRRLGGQKLQTRTPSFRATVGKGLAYVSLNSVATLAFSFVLWPLYRWRLHQGAWPAAWVIGGQVLLFLLVDDALFYVAHRVLHTKWLYRRIHSWHHRYHAPYALLGSIMHPVEWLIINGIVVVVPLACGMHVGVFFVCIVLRQWTNAEFHAGVEGWWSLLSKLPGAGGVRHHDLHHERVRGNYASLFAHWDRWLGTELKAPR